MINSLSTEVSCFEDTLNEIKKMKSGKMVLLGGLDSLIKLKSFAIRENPHIQILDFYLPTDSFFSSFGRYHMLNPFIFFQGIIMIAYDQYQEAVMKLGSMEDCKGLRFSEEIEEAIAVIFNKPKHNAFMDSRTYMNNHGGKLVLRTNDMIKAIRIDEIIMVKSENNYTNFYLADGSELLITKGLNVFEKKLSMQGFMRVHQSFLVNLNHIKAFMKKKGKLVMSNEVSIPVSKTKKIKLLKYLDGLGL